MESLHGNKMGSLYILEQFEHVNWDFNVSIFEFDSIIYSLSYFKIKKKREIIKNNFATTITSKQASFTNRFRTYIIDKKIKKIFL
jgi:hypothetical protein